MAVPRELAGMLILPALVAATVAGILIPTLDRWARGHGWLDVPNPRSSHREPTPRVGGVAIVTAVFVGLVVARTMDGTSVSHAVAIATGGLAIAVMSFVDDLRPLPALLRLGGQVLIAMAVVLDVGPWSAHAMVDDVRVITLAAGGVWIVALVNAYNFMDGIDGLAGSQAIVAGVGWAIVGVVTGSPALTTLAVLVATVSAVFLCFNWHPARVFMGDTGSSFLGYVFAVIPLVIASPRTLAAAALFVWPFIFDTGLTLVRRIARGENVLTPHHTHLYQRLISTGLSHAQVTLVYVLLGALGLPAGVLAATGSPAMAGVLSGIVVGVAAVLCRVVTAREAAARDRGGLLGRGFA